MPISATDQLGRTVTMTCVPRRIVSLVPSLTELLCDLGLRDWIVGCTKFCVHPAGLRAGVSIVGGTKNVRVAEVLALAPDLVLASKEENVRAQVDEIAASCPTWVSDVTDLASADDLARRLGRLFGVEQQAARITAANRATLARLAVADRGAAVYLIWREPYMGAGGGTYIDSVLGALGFRNALAARERYPEITEDALRRLAPEHVLLSSEPYPFAERHAAELRALLPGSEVRLVDGELFSWWGSRLMHYGAEATAATGWRPA